MLPVVLLLAACEEPAYEYRNSAPCLPGTGMVITWCTDDGACEFRVVGGITTSCPADDSERCVEAVLEATEACRAGQFDGGLPTTDAGTFDGGLPTTDAGTFDGGLPTDTGPTCAPTGELDLLFMVDNSNSMTEEQGLVRAEIPRMLTVLSTHVSSLHVGIVTSDMGAGPVPAGAVVPSCNPGFGDDGVMRLTSRGGTGCEETYPSRVFAFEGTADEVPNFATAIGCVAEIGTGGCGFEQQLEATLKALSPASLQPWVASTYAPPTFVGPSDGHGDGSNDGFLRADSVLALILLTDEEDCSVPEYNLFYANDPEYIGNPLNLRCSRFASTALYPTSRYVDGFLQLRSSPTRLVYAPIVGIPDDLVSSSYEAMLADPRLEETEDSSMVPPQRLIPSCHTTNGVAFPPRRIIDVARGLRDRGARTTVQSICAPSFGPEIDSILALIDVALSCEP